MEWSWGILESGATKTQNAVLLGHGIYVYIRWCKICSHPQHFADMKSPYKIYVTTEMWNRDVRGSRSSLICLRARKSSEIKLNAYARILLGPMDCLAGTE